jgi:hypothetical protein
MTRKKADSGAPAASASTDGAASLSRSTASVQCEGSGHRTHDAAVASQLNVSPFSRKSDKKER